MKTGSRPVEDYKIGEVLADIAVQPDVALVLEGTGNVLAEITLAMLCRVGQARADLAGLGAPRGRAEMVIELGQEPGEVSVTLRWPGNSLRSSTVTLSAGPDDLAGGGGHMAVRTFTGKDVKDTSPENYQVTWEGRVLATGEHNGYDDSDFYAVVWDDEQGAPREVTYASTRGWTYNNSATVDADEATRAKYDAYRERQRASLEAVTVRVGKTVRVARGRSVPVGTTGKVFWYGPGRKRYAYDRNPGYRVGLRTEDGEKFFTDARNVEVAA